MTLPPQFTSAQILDAARRAEGEGKLDYALQFYRYIVDFYASEPEAYEARDGFLRLTQQRRADSIRNRHTTMTLGTAGEEPRTPSNGATHETRFPGPPPLNGQSSTIHENTDRNLPQVIAKKTELPVEVELEFAFKDRYRAGTLMAHGANWLGWISVGVGTALAGAGIAGVPKPMAVPSVLGLPSGLVYGLEAVAAGLALVFLSQLAQAVFDNANATRHVLAIERAKAQL